MTQAEMVEASLTKAQKRDVAMARLWEEGAPLTSHTMVRHDERYGWDFSIVRVRDSEGEEDEIIITISVPITSRRFAVVMQRCAAASERVIRGETDSAFSGSGPFAETRF